MIMRNVRNKPQNLLQNVLTNAYTAAKRANKPVILEEFGLGGLGKSPRKLLIRIEAEFWL